jgi:protein tyrosine phosphatase (PTP) superfamily phosphohydrolase (DUF442 family)
LKHSIIDCISESDDSERLDDDGIGIRNKRPADGQGDQPNKRQKKEFLRQNAMFMDGTVQGVHRITEQPTLGQVQRKCQLMCSWDGYVYAFISNLANLIQGLK